MSTCSVVLDFGSSGVTWIWKGFVLGTSEVFVFMGLKSTTIADFSTYLRGLVLHILLVTVNFIAIELLQILLIHRALKLAVSREDHLF